MKEQYLALMRKLYGMAFHYSGITNLFYRRGLNKRRIQILCYHQIDRSSFEAHLRYLTRHYKIVSLADVYLLLTEKRSWEPGILALTFDDGHLSFYKQVFPVLREYGIPATLFVATDVIGTGAMYWFDQVDTIIDGTEEKQVHIGEETYSIPRSNRYAVKEAIKDRLKVMPESEKKGVIEALASRSRYRRGQMPEAARVIDWKQAAEIEASGIVKIGGHTCSHPILSRVTASVARREIMESRQILQNRLGANVEFFAYPNGEVYDLNENIMEYVQEAGYLAAVTLQEGVCSPGDNLFALRRITASGGFGFQALATKMSGIWPSH